MVGLLDGGKTLRICITIYTQYRRVTDRCSDRQTSCHGIVRAMHTRRVVKTARKLKKLRDPRELRIVPPNLSLACVNLTFDLLTHKVGCFVSCRMNQFASRSVLLSSKYGVHRFGNRRADGQTNEQAENIMLPPASVAWQTYKKVTLTNTH